MAQANKVSILTTDSCAWMDIEMNPVRDTGEAYHRPYVRVDIHHQLMSPSDLRVVARLLEQAADRKEVLFNVVAAS